jgi:hypothetical protein
MDAPERRLDRPRSPNNTAQGRLNPSACYTNRAIRQDDEPGAGRGAGFGLIARPSGAWIVEDGQATWKPAIDINRIVIGGQVIALTAILITGRILHSQSHHHHALRGLASHLPDRRSVQLGRPRRQHTQRHHPKLIHHLP